MTDFPKKRSPQPAAPALARRAFRLRITQAKAFAYSLIRDYSQITELKKSGIMVILESSKSLKEKEFDSYVRFGFKGSRSEGVGEGTE